MPEPLLAFDPVDPGSTAENPLVGMANYGPYSATMFARLGRSVRIAIMAPERDLSAVRAQLNELKGPLEPRERPTYVPLWPGFRSVFQTPIVPADETAQLPLPSDLDAILKTAASPHLALLKALADGLHHLTLVRDRFEVVVFYLPPRYGNLFEVPEQGFDLHAEVKAVGAELGLTTQILTQQAIRYRCRASVAWRLGTALYAKAGGSPWKLATRTAPLHRDAAYIGLSYALRTAADKTSFVTCCSQVFEADGGGMEFVAYEVGEGVDARNPHLTRDDMRIVLARSMALYQDRNAGRTPRRLVVHKQTPFTADEAAGAFDAWGATTEISCINLTRTPWMGVSLDAPRGRHERSRPGYAVRRGTALQLDGNSALVWIAGNAPAATLTGSGNYVQGGKGTPRPILLTRDAGRGPLQLDSAEVLALSKMDWNNDALYDAIPCTVRYAQVLARTIKHIGTLEQRPYDYRLFM